MPRRCGRSWLAETECSSLALGVSVTADSHVLQLLHTMCVCRQGGVCAQHGPLPAAGCTMTACTVPHLIALLMVLWPEQRLLICVDRSTRVSGCSST